MLTKNNLYILVTYAGALPFIACAIMLYSGIHTVEGFGSVSNISAVFALIIVSFIAGLHLGTYLLYRTKTPKPLFIISNVIAVIAWISLLVTNIKVATAVLVFAFVYLLLVDYMLRRELFLSKSYFNTRLIVTLITTGSLLVTSGIG
jgi:LytS/YehU family sensor histidine kinase